MKKKLVAVVSITLILYSSLLILSTKADSSLITENWESGLSNWTDINPPTNLSTVNAYSGTHSLWGNYTTNTKLSRNFEATPNDLLLSFEIYAPHQIDGWYFAQSVSVNSNDNTPNLQVMFGDYGGTPYYEMDWTSGYPSYEFGPLESFEYSTWNNVTAYVHFWRGSNDWGYVLLWFNDELVLNQTNIYNQLTNPDKQPDRITAIVNEGNVGSYIDDISLKAVGSYTPPSPTPTQTPAPSPTPTASPISTPTAIPTFQPTPIPTSNPTSAPNTTPSVTPSPTSTSNPTFTPKIVPTQETQTASSFQTEHIAVATIAVIAAVATTIVIVKKKM